MTHYKLIKSLVAKIRHLRDQVADFRGRYYMAKEHFLDAKESLAQLINEQNEKDRKLFELQLLLKKYRSRGDDNGVQRVLTDIENL